MKKIRIAQIGTSRYSHGTEIFATVAANKEDFEVVGYALPEGERERFPDRMDAFEGYREMTVEEILNDPTIDAVLVETEEVHLTKYAKMVARANKHLHMEKPGGTEPSEFEELMAMIQEKELVFHTGYMYRYNPMIRDILDRVKAGEIGEVISVETQMSGWRDLAQNRFLEAFPGGMMFYLGCHLIDLVLQIQGMPKRIIPFNKVSGAYDTEAKDFSMAIFEYENGVSFVKTTQAERGGFSRRQLVITGTKGKFEVRPLEISIKYPLQYTECTECMSEVWGDAGVRKRSPDHDRYTDMMADFAKLIRGETDTPYTHEYELNLYRILQECCK